MKYRRISKAAGLFLILTLLFALFAVTPAAAAVQPTGYVTDTCGLLSDDEVSTLEAMAQEVSDTYSCGVYMLIIDDYRTTNDSLADYNEDFYFDNGLGVGDGMDAIILTLSMGDRSYDIMAHGDFANMAFTDYGKEVLADSFLDDFGNDDWYTGFQDYVDNCGSFMQQAQDGTPVDVGSGGLGIFGIILRFVLIPFGAAAVVCFILKSKMNNVAAATNASEYVTEGGMTFTRRMDLFSHTTETRVRIQEKESGGTTVNDSGSSHSGGHF